MIQIIFITNKIRNRKDIIAVKIAKMAEIRIFQFIYLNFLCRKVQRKGHGFIIPYRGSVIELAPASRIILHDGHFEVNYFKPRWSRGEAYVRMAQGSVLEIEDSVKLCYHAMIEAHVNSRITIGSAYINSGAVILSAEEIRIGKEVLVSRGVFIYDSAHHPIVDENDRQVNLAKPVVVGDHVWIGLKSVLLRGSRIGEGAVIAAGSVVGGKVKDHTMASGNPARSYAEIKWKDSL